MAENLIMPTLGLTMTEGTVDQWYKKIGDTVEKGEAVCSISSEKLSKDVEAPISGTLLAIVTKTGETALCQKPIGIVGEAGEEVNLAEKVVATEAVSTLPLESEKKSKAKKPQRVFATPSARKLALEKGLEISDVLGTGDNHRVTRRDVENHVSQLAPTILVTSQEGDGLKGMRKVIAERMHRSLQQTAQLSLQRKADITALKAFRQELKTKAGQNLDQSVISLNMMLIKAVTRALIDYPEMNAWYGDGHYELKSDINIGIAVAVDNGLLVPVLMQTNQQSLSSLTTEFSEITSGAQAGTLTSERYTGSTFTISNLGQSGIEYFTPILNTPEVGILGVGTSQPRLVFNSDKEVVERLELPLSLTFDHQVIDGTPAGEFLKQICFYLENPYLLVL